MSDQNATFATALNCMDGRTQLPVNEVARERYGATFIDTITEAGIVKLLSVETDHPSTQTVLERVRISVEKHGSENIAVVAHHDCAGNPVEAGIQKEQLSQAVTFLKGHFPQCRVEGYWVGDSWTVDILS